MPSRLALSLDGAPVSKVAMAQCRNLRAPSRLFDAMSLVSAPTYPLLHRVIS